MSTSELNQLFNGYALSCLQVSLLESLLRVLGPLQMGKLSPLLEADKFFYTLSPFLVFFSHLQGSQGNQKKMFIATTTQLLEPILNARSLLAREKNNVTYERILKQLDTISLQLFNKYVFQSCRFHSLWREEVVSCL